MRGKKMTGFPSREQAMQDFFAAWNSNIMVETIPIMEACGRILAEDMYSKNTLPVYRISACDGIAIKSADFVAGMPDYTTWKIGKNFVRADTGDDFPDDFDAVIPIEEVDFTESDGIAFISPDVDLKVGVNVRPPASTIAKGDFLLQAGLPLRPADLAVLAMGGHNVVPVRRKPRVAFIPTGTELIPCGQTPGRGQNVDSNSVMVKHMLLEMGAEPILFPITADDPARIAAALEDALTQADLVVLNAGTAKGEEDFNFFLLGERGELIHHYIAAAPGRPMALAVVDHKPVINLPGPTMAAYYGCDWCVRAAVCRMLNIPLPKRQTIRGTLMEDLTSPAHMAILCKMQVRATPDGYAIYPVSFKDSTQTAALTSNALHVANLGEEKIARGENIEVELLRGEEFICGG